MRAVCSPVLAEDPRTGAEKPSSRSVEPQPVGSRLSIPARPGSQAEQQRLAGRGGEKASSGRCFRDRKRCGFQIGWAANLPSHSTDRIFSPMLITNGDEDMAAHDGGTALQHAAPSAAACWAHDILVERLQ